MSEWVLWLIAHQWAMYVVAWCLAGGIWLVLRYYTGTDWLGAVLGIGVFLFGGMFCLLEWHLCVMGIIGLVAIAAPVHKDNSQEAGK